MQDNYSFEDGENDQRTPSRFKNIRDTLAVKSPLRTSENTVDTNSLVSEPDSILPELTISEERAIRLSGANFQPIQTPPDIVITPATDEVKVKSMNERHYENINNWKPSEDITKHLEDQSEFGKSKDWNGDGIEMTHDRKYSPIPIIPSISRESTPVSVASTGDRWLRNNDNHRSVQFNPTNVQQNQTEGNGRAKIPDIGKSTREMVTKMSIYVRPDDIELTPANDDVTDGSLGKRKTLEAEKGSDWLVTKIIMFVLAVMIILAGIVALIVQFKSKDPKGSSGKIIPNPILHNECPDVTVNLGDDVNFACSFDLTHGYRKDLKNYDNFAIAPRNRIVSEEYLSFSGIREKDKKSLNITFKSVGWKARCSTEGQYYIYLKNETNNLLHTAIITIRLKSSTLNTTLEQHLVETCPESGEVKTYFEATCFLSGDCNSYQPSIVRRSARGVEPLNHLMECQKTYTDEAGYSVRCSANVPENLITDDSHLRCSMTSPTSRLPDKIFELPQCERTSSCLVITPQVPYPFNCSSKSTHYQRLLDASCNFDAVRNCLQPGRKIFNFHKTFEGNLTCDESDRSVPVCRLSWCVDYRYIFKNIIPGQLICGDNFSEQEYKPPPTTPSTVPTTP